MGSHEAIFKPHSSATGLKNGKVRACPDFLSGFHKLAFAAQMTTSQQALQHRVPRWETGSIADVARIDGQPLPVTMCRHLSSAHLCPGWAYGGGVYWGADNKVPGGVLPPGPPW